MLKLTAIIAALVTAGALQSATPLQIEPLPSIELETDDSVGVATDTYIGMLDPKNPRVAVNTVVGTFAIDLTPEAAPRTVENFLRYVVDDAYTDSIFHRSVPEFVIQGGGYYVENNELKAIVANPAVVNEPNVSNTRGTVAMAKIGGDPNSATNQWFVNISDNGDNLDNQNGGFTVFGNVVGAGMQVVDAIAALPRFNLGGALSEIPLVDFEESQQPQVNNLVLISGIERIASDPEQVADADKTTIEVVSNSNPDVAFVNVVDRNIGIVSGSNPGRTEVTVRVSGGGESIENTFTVTVGGEALSIADIFPGNAELGDGWHYSHWLGSFNVSAWPWIFSEAHGWWYIASGADESLWAYDIADGMGWLWTSESIYPMLYHADNDEFIYFDAESSTATQRWFNFPGNGGWRLVE